MSCGSEICIMHTLSIGDRISDVAPVTVRDRCNVTFFPNSEDYFRHWHFSVVYRPYSDSFVIIL